MAVAWAMGCSSDLTPSLGTSICLGFGPKKQKKKKKKKKKRKQTYFHLKIADEEFSGSIMKPWDLSTVRKIVIRPEAEQSRARVI